MKIEEFYSVNYMEKSGSADTQTVGAPLHYQVDYKGYIQAKVNSLYVSTLLQVKRPSWVPDLYSL